MEESFYHKNKKKMENIKKKKKMAEKLNKEREGRTDKVMKKKKKRKKKRERKVERKKDCKGIFVTASMPVSVKKKKNKK